MEKYLLALDQGTTSSRAIIFNKKGEIMGFGRKEFRQIFPKPGWVEHDPHDLLKSQLSACTEAFQKSGVESSRIAAIGITNQRETTLLWERVSGQPVFNAIVWQCRRTAPLCERLKAAGLEKEIRSRTGLVIDPYFSGTKIVWLLENISGLRRRAAKGEIIFGTVDSWLLYNLTGLHVTEPSNASRTLLYNIHTGRWDDDLLRELKIPAVMLPEIRASSGDFGVTERFGPPLPVTGAAGDQQAALFGQGCCAEGEVKNTYGTGCFLLMHTGKKPVTSEHNLLTTVAWDLGSGLDYALEGAVFVAGAVVQWLRDELGLIGTAAESEALARSVPDAGGVVFVPAFTGLGAPYWNANARGTLLGLTRGTTKAQIVRAALESIAFQSRDLLSALKKDLGTAPKSLKADGGASANDFLMQFQADILGIPVVRPRVIETTAFGAAALAGLSAGFWDDVRDVTRDAPPPDVFTPAMKKADADERYARWQQAVQTAERFPAAAF